MGLLPRPLLSAALFVGWLVLGNSAAPADILAGALVALLLPRLLARFLPPPLAVHNPAVVVVLALRVLADIVVANLEVARRILGPESSIRPRFVWIPLEIENTFGVAALAGIISLTPGTLSVDLSTDRRHLLVHGLHVDDEAALVARIKARYEAPLKRIFR